MLDETDVPETSQSSGRKDEQKASDELLGLRVQLHEALEARRKMERLFMRQQRTIRRLMHWLTRLETAIQLLYRSRRWRLANPLRVLGARMLPAAEELPRDGYREIDKVLSLFRKWKAYAEEQPEFPMLPVGYDAWLDRQRPDRSEAASMTSRWQDRADAPRFKVLFCSSSAGEEEIAAARETRVRQVYPYLAEETGCLQTAALQDCSHVIFAGRGDAWEPQALCEFAEAIMLNPDAAIVYADFDAIRSGGSHGSPYFKPDWSPETFHSHNYLTGLLAVRADLAMQARRGHALGSGAEEYDWLLRVTALDAGPVIHIPKILAHLPEQDVPKRLVPGDGGAASIQRALRLRGEQATARIQPEGFGYEIRWSLPVVPHVSIIIPTRDAFDFLSSLISTLKRYTDHPSWDVTIVDNGSTDKRTLEFLDVLAADVSGRFSIMRDAGPFNFARLMNRAAERVSGDALLFLNNDIELTHSGWLDRMVEQLLRPGIGAVGARLLYPGGTIQHQGVVLGIGGIAGHAFRFCDPGCRHAWFQAQIVRNYSAATAACLLVRRNAFEEVGGFDEGQFAVDYNDVDLCLRLGESGYRIVVDPNVTAIHHESATARQRGDAFEQERFLRRWASKTLKDPFYNPWLSLTREDFSMKESVITGGWMIR